MKRGIIRIIAGIVMIILQILAMVGQSLAEDTYNTNTSIWYDIGFYSAGITGGILLFVGIRVCSDGLYSKLILHSKTKTIHTVTRWVMFSISTLLFVLYVISFIYYFPDFNIFTILMIFATLSFALYTLLYIYKKPCCLFSTALIFTGVAYLYGIISNLTDYILYFPNYMDNYGLYVIFGIIPVFITGILYIIIAVNLYKEKFSVNVIRVLGWIAFALEFTNQVLCDLIVFQNFYFYDISNILFILLTIGIVLYTSVFEINTLRGIVVADNDDSSKFCCTHSVEAINRPNVIVPKTNIVELCKKCGADITNDTYTCRVCGEPIDNEVTNNEQ